MSFKVCFLCYKNSPDYLSYNVPIGDVIEVASGTRLTFVCRNCNCCNPLCWGVDKQLISERMLHDSPNFYNVTIIHEHGSNCTNEFAMTVLASAAPYHITIHCGDDHYKKPICSRNVSANFILVKVKEDHNIIIEPSKSM